jgi:acyl-coenzyme A thioesterase PaaI-like protein
MPMTDEQLVERFNDRRAATSVLLNAHFLEVRAADGYVRIRYDIGSELCNPSGAVQGGIVTAMLDDAAAFACIVKAGKAIYVASLELKTTFLSAVIALSSVKILLLWRLS